MIIRHALLGFLFTAASAHAAPAVTAKEYLKNSYGAVRYSVKCDSGAAAVVQCAKGRQQCGKSKLALEEEMRRACGS